MAIIDPISIATQGYIIKNTPKQLFGITLATLGYIKPGELEDEFRRKYGGGSGVAVGFKRSKPLPKKEVFYDLTMSAAFTCVNDKDVDQELVVTEYKDSHMPIKVDIDRLVHKNNEVDLTLYEVTATTVKPKIIVGSVKLNPIRTTVSSSVKIRRKPKKKK